MSSGPVGYTCNCGAFVPLGTSHQCPKTTWPYGGSADVIMLERIAKALERIAEALEYR